MSWNLLVSLQALIDLVPASILVFLTIWAFNRDWSIR